MLTARVWLTQWPFANAVTEFLVASAFAPVAGLAVQFLLRYARMRRRPLDAALLPRSAR